MAAGTMGWMDCDSMSALPWKLQMQELARNINYGSAALSHVHWASQFKLFRSRQYMLPYLALRIIVVHRVHVKDVGSRRDS